jgi:hypothetical protein
MFTLLSIAGYLFYPGCLERNICEHFVLFGGFRVAYRFSYMCWITVCRCFCRVSNVGCVYGMSIFDCPFRFYLPSVLFPGSWRKRIAVGTKEYFSFLFCHSCEKNIKVWEAILYVMHCNFRFLSSHVKEYISMWQL